MRKLNCWEYKKCGREPGGQNVKKLGECPAAQMELVDEINNGVRAGRVCWVVAGTFCKGKVQGSFAQKLDNCLDCDFYKKVCEEEGENFDLGSHLVSEIYSPAQISQAYEQLHFYYNNLKKMQQKMVNQDKLASIGQQAAGVIHEINNPLSFIISNTQTLVDYIDVIKKCLNQYNQLTRFLKNNNQEELKVLLSDIEKHHQKENISFILEDLDSILEDSISGLDRVKEIVKNIRTCSRVGAGDYSHANINELVENAVKIVNNDFRMKGEILKEYAELPEVFCESSKISQVILNILTNAADAVDKDGVIVVKTKDREKDVMIQILDNGCGMSEKQISEIFTPFFTTKEVGKGTGLGLSISYDIIKAHQGEILVTSEINKGSEFTITIAKNLKEEDIVEALNSIKPSL